MKIVVLWEADFPTVDSVAWTQEALAQAAGKKDTLLFVSVEGLADALRETSAVLVTPYGSAFPKAAWTTIYEFLARGGSWVNLGGSPFSRPVRKNSDGTWHIEVSTTAYSKELFINQAFPVELNGDEEYFWLASSSEELEGTLKCARAWSLQVRFTDTKDFPQEHGSGGSRDAALRTLCYSLRDEKRIAAPIVVIDRLHGSFAGGSWALVNAELTEPLGATLLQRLIRVAAQGPIELDIRPTFACFYEGEQPSVTVRIKAHRLPGEAKFFTDILTDASHRGYKETLTLTDTPIYRRIPLKPPWTPGRFEPGLYTAICELSVDGFIKTSVTGFWIYDEVLLTSAKPLTLNRDYFERDGEPYPVMGTTYMAGDTHRKFLFEPNPAVWDEDFAAMKAAGVNMVRTGLWTGWKRAMLDPGAMDEGVLRAFTAFLLTARKYDIPVIFNFFAFLPEGWNGVNPYLDPRSVEAQKEFVAAFAHRFANVNDLIWDFINEPSFCSPPQTWRTRPNYDRFERAAWAQWLTERRATFSEAEKQAADPDDVWRERWRLTPNAPLDLPALEDFNDAYIFQGTHPLRVLDYRLFAQEMFCDWVRKLSAVIRSNGNPHQLITVGQDEGGTGERPNTHFYADVVDFTTNHSWWQNDDLLWDSVMTKTPNKPNLIQETGIMFVENVDGGYRRTPEECANLLARKLMFAFAAGCAGAIQWLWNTNVYMDSDNEVGIGFLRADGTEKPELEVFRGIAKFMWENRQKMVGRQLEEAVLVIPHSNMFSVRDTANAATRRAVRTLEYDLGVPTRTVGEYKIEDIGDPKLIILPSPRILTQRCWEHLLKKVETGATLLVTGPIDWDEYWRPIERLSALNGDLNTETFPIVRAEDWERLHPVYHGTSAMLFGGDKIQKLDRALKSQSLPYGSGKILFDALPVELSDTKNSTIYEDACEQAGVLYHDVNTYGIDGRMVRVCRFAETTMFLFVDEARHDYGIGVLYAEQGYDLSIRVGNYSVAIVFCDSNTRSVLSSFSEKPSSRKQNEENAKETNS